MGTKRSFNMDIGYTMPGEIVQSTVPLVAWDDTAWRLCDAAYDVLEHTPEGFYPEWERIVCTIIAPKLEECEDGHAVSFNIRGTSWTFTRAHSDFSA